MSRNDDLIAEHDGIIYDIASELKVVADYLDKHPDAPLKDLKDKMDGVGLDLSCYETEFRHLKALRDQMIPEYPLEEAEALHDSITNR